MSLDDTEAQALRRRLQKARAVAKCIRIAADCPDDDLDLDEAVGGLLLLLEGAIATLDQARGRHDPR